MYVGCLMKLGAIANDKGALFFSVQIQLIHQHDAFYYPHQLVLFPRGKNAKSHFIEVRIPSN